MPIDVIISPEREVARAIGRRLQVPGALDVVPMADGKVRVVGVRCEESTPIVNTPLRQLTSLFTDLAIVIVGILRNERAIVPKPEDQMLPGDEANGRASCRERVLQHVEISVVDVYLTKKKTN